MLGTKYSDRTVSTTHSRRWAAPVALLWLLAVTGLAVIATRAQATHLLTLIRLYPERERSLVFVLATVGLATALSVALGFVRPTWRRRAILALALLPAPVLLITSRNVVAGFAAVTVLVPVCWLGRETAGRVLRPIDRVDAWIVGSTFGIALLAVLGFGLGWIGLLRPWAIWPFLLALIGLLALLRTARRRLHDDIAAFRNWLVLPATQRPVPGAALGILIGYLWLNLIGALAPEIMSDAIRQRLAAAAFFAREGRLAAHPDLTITLSPRVGEMLYAVILASGPLQAAKLVNLLVGLLCGAGVWALGRRLGNDQAALAALLAFYSLPLTTWLSQTAYIDLVATLFAVIAALIMALHDRLNWRVVAATTACIGAGLGVKASFGSAAVGLVAALVLLALWHRRAGAVAVGAALVAGVLPLTLLWATRGAGIPGFASGVEHLAHFGREMTSLFAYYEEFGTGRTPIALARSPLNLTLHSDRYSEYGEGFTGYLLLALAPLVALSRPRRHVAVLLAGVATAYLVWFSVAQYLRYALPIFAVLCAVGGASFSRVTQARKEGGISGTMMGMLLLVLATLGLIGYLNTILVYPGTFPYRVVLGNQSKETYLANNVPAYPALRLLDAEPNATRAVAAGEYAQLYARVRLSHVAYTAHIQTEEMLLPTLDQQGYSHIVVDRGTLPRNWDIITVIGEEFLRRNTVLVGGDHNAYLYRILPPEQRGRDQIWARGGERLVNGGFEEAGGALPNGWTAVGHPVSNMTGEESRIGRGAVRGTPQDALLTTAAVTPNSQYLLSHATRGAGGEGLARLQINWLDNAGKPAGVSIEVVPVSPRGFRLHSMLATAPPTATSAVVYAQAQQGEVWFDDVSLRSMLSDPQPAGRMTAEPPATPSRGPLTVQALQPATVLRGAEAHLGTDRQLVLTVECKNALPGSTIMVDGIPLVTTFIDWKRLTVVVSPVFYVTPSRHQISIRDDAGESNRVEFVVEP